MVIKKNPNFHYAKSFDGNYLFFVNNERYIFKHPRAENFIPSLFSALDSEIHINDLNKQIDFFIGREDEFQKLIDSFMKLKFIFNSDKNLSNEYFFQAYSRSTSDLQKEMKRFFILSSVFDVSKLQQKIFSYNKQVEEIKNPDDINELNSLVIVITSKANFSQLFAINKKFNQLKIPWLWFEVEDTSLQIGPAFNSNNEFCFNCYYLRSMARANSTEIEEVFLNPSNEYQSTEKIELSSLWVEIINLEIKKFILESDQSKLLKGFHISNYYKNTTDFHRLLIAPTCKVCFPTLD